MPKIRRQNLPPALLNQEAGAARTSIESLTEKFLLINSLNSRIGLLSSRKFQ